VNSRQAVINGEETTLDVAPLIRESTTYVPARFVSEALGVPVRWDSKNRIVTLLPKMMPEPIERPTVAIGVNGTDVNIAGYVDKGVTMIPLQAVFSELGANITWNSATSTFSIKYHDKEMLLTAGENKVVVNGVSIELSRKVEIHNGRVYAPAREVIEVFSGIIRYDQSLNKIFIEL
jgi:hypothetical protein